MLSRRDLVGKLAAGTALVWAAGAARTGFAAIRRESNAPAGSRTDGGSLAAAPSANAPRIGEGPLTTESAAAPWELLDPLAMGSEVANGWRVAGLTGAVDGSCVVTLQNERGRALRVHVCRNDGRPQGLVYTRRFDLVVMNGGQGDLPTEEGFAQAVAELAHVLAANEVDPRQASVVAALMPHSERVHQFSDRRLR